MSFPLPRVTVQETEFTSEKFNACGNITDSDKNSVEKASQVISASFAGVFYLVMFFQSILGICIKALVRNSSSQGTLFVFFVGALFACINVITNGKDPHVKLCFRLFTVPLIGIIYMIFGAALFFRRPLAGGTLTTLGRQQPSMGLVVSIITLPLVGIEIVLLIATFASKSTDETNEHLNTIEWRLVKIDKSLFLAQKVCQALWYLYLRKTTIRQDFEEDARFYFRLLSFFNLIEWIDSQVNVESDVRWSGIGKEFDGWFNFFTVLYQALIIDYRLLCSLLFLEHSIEVQNGDEPVEENNNGGNNQDVGLRKCCGYVIGCLCFIAPIFCAFYDANAFHLRGGVNALAVVVNLVVVVCVVRLLCNNNLDADRIQHRESQGVKIMVCCLGAVGFTYWLMEASIACFWAEKNRLDPSISWTASKFVLRSVTTAFLIGLFMKINVRAFPSKNPTNSGNHTLVPIVMLGVISMFAEGLIDQKVGKVGQCLRNHIEDQSLKILFEVGPPMYLGFLLHVFLYFMVLATRLRHSATLDIPLD